MLAGLLLLLAPLLFLWASSGRLLLHSHALSFRDVEKVPGQAHRDQSFLHYETRQNHRSRCNRVTRATSCGEVYVQ